MCFSNSAGPRVNTRNLCTAGAGIETTTTPLNGPLHARVERGLTERYWQLPTQRTADVLPWDIIV
jgi:hypothetical protein